MKTPPQGPEFTRFREAIAKILKVPKGEVQKRIQAEKKRKANYTFRFPRPCRLSKTSGLERLWRRFSHLAGQLCIGQSLTCDLRYCQRETVCIIQWIVFGCAVVEAECLLIHVARKMERLDRNIGSTQAALEQ